MVAKPNDLTTMQPAEELVRDLLAQTGLRITRQHTALTALFFGDRGSPRDGRQPA